jgi:muramoyltetrapeptide carboxypeptidase
MRFDSCLVAFDELPINTLRLGIYAQTGLVTFHGNMVMYYFGMEPQKYDRQEFMNLGVKGKIGPVEKNSQWYTVRGIGAIEGKLLCGNDWVMQWLLWTPYCVIGFAKEEDS